MNKLTKSAIAGAAGIALLLGGAGSLAYWNDSASLTGGTITAGELTITANGTGTWKDSNDTTISLASFHAVPGDVLTYTANFDVSAVGDNLSATVALTGDSIAAASAAGADVKLASLLTKSAVLKVNGVATTTVSPAAGTQTITVSVSITWPNGTTADDNAAMNGAVDLSNMTITLTQNP
ncbi:MAG: alternate-type signal peptide domain-containing protein [Cryobacterium sp.]|nr:alternate-type signal peptide domain-containing protein [Micrococcales bacterium]MBX3079422.1 alternate-type signal peptide domain-containing protein [Cryobacterium sp.]MBX3309145.1 alternate-type signal peptide domain-containing protein [Cryobacterium sp.]HNP14842.1 alternate-type signal peptide domain-containing protein [Terrimesophilobacter sp.]